MQDDTLPALVSKTALLMEGFERRCQGIEQQLQVLAKQLGAVTQQLPAVLKQSADGTLRSLPPQIVDSVRHGLQNPIGDYEQRLDAAGHALNDGSQALAKQLEEQRRLARHLTWKIVGVTIVSLVLMVGAGLWFSLHYAEVIRQNQVSAKLLKAYNRADVVLCEGRVCFNADTRSKRYGAKGEYMQAKDR
jgi:hypothetical protein